MYMDFLHTQSDTYLRGIDTRSDWVFSQTVFVVADSFSRAVMKIFGRRFPMNSNYKIPEEGVLR